MTHSPDPSPTLAALARTMAVDRHAVEAVEAWRLHGIPSILLKGATLAEWLWAGTAIRQYADADLLVPPWRFGDAARVLERLGYRAWSPEETGERQPHARAFVRDRDGALVDLHRTLPGLRAIDPGRAWRVLAPHRVPLRIGGGVVDALDEPGRLTLVALHVEHHRVDGWVEKPDVDLARALEVADDAHWREAAALAEALEAVPAFVYGLRSTPRGDALAERLGLMSATLASTVSLGVDTPLATGIDRLVTVPGVLRKATIVGREVLPAPSFMRFQVRRARHSRLGLVRSYIDRWVWLARTAGPSYRAWRDAQR